MRRVEVPDALPELRATRRVMAEVAEPAHLKRVAERRAVERCRLTQGCAPMARPKPVHRREQSVVQELQGGLRPARGRRRARERCDRQEQKANETRCSPRAHAITK